MRYGDVMTYRSDPSLRRTGVGLPLARGLGWLSIGLGVAEVLAPGMLARALGLEGKETLLRLYGAREIVTGMAILGADDPTPWIWGRLGGDAVDLATLAVGYNDENPNKEATGLALAACAGITALDAVCAWRLSAEDGGGSVLVWDYSDRSGLPQPPEAMRGAARDLAVPRDMRTPEAMRPYPLETVS